VVDYKTSVSLLDVLLVCVSRCEQNTEEEEKRKMVLEVKFGCFLNGVTPKKQPIAS